LDNIHAILEKQDKKLNSILIKIDDLDACILKLGRRCANGGQNKQLLNNSNAYNIMIQPSFDFITSELENQINSTLVEIVREKSNIARRILEVHNKQRNELMVSLADKINQKKQELKCFLETQKLNASVREHDLVEAILLQFENEKLKFSFTNDTQKEEKMDSFADLVKTLDKAIVSIREEIDLFKISSSVSCGSQEKQENSFPDSQPFKKKFCSVAVEFKNIQSTFCYTNNYKNVPNDKDYLSINNLPKTVNVANNELKHNQEIQELKDKNKQLARELAESTLKYDKHLIESTRLEIINNEEILLKNKQLLVTESIKEKLTAMLLANESAINF
jgi:hypothetical protein